MNLSDMFPKNKKGHTMDKRQNEKFVIRKARTERLQRSAVMHMQRLLNNENLKNRKIMSAIKNIMPVNYDCLLPSSDSTPNSISTSTQLNLHFKSIQLL